MSFGRAKGRRAAKSRRRSGALCTRITEPGAVATALNVANDFYELNPMATKFSEQKQSEKRQKALPPVDRELIAQGVRLILQGLGEDLARPGLLETPHRGAALLS